MLCFHESVKFSASGFLLRFGEQQFLGAPTASSFLYIWSLIKSYCVQRLLQMIEEGCVPSGWDNRSKIEDDLLHLSFLQTTDFVFSISRSHSIFGTYLYQKLFIIYLNSGLTGKSCVLPDNITRGPFLCRDVSLVAGIMGSLKESAPGGE